MKREIEAINHHRTILKNTLEELEMKFHQLSLHPSSGNDHRGGGGENDEETTNWEISRLKFKVSKLSDLLSLYRSGILALYSNGLSYSASQQQQQQQQQRNAADSPVSTDERAGVAAAVSSLPVFDWMERDVILQNYYEEEIQLLDNHINEVQMKLKQYRKYGIEVRKQFEEMLKSIHR
jgi:prefoldin subunit 5